jgi:hypothetical protein
MDLLTLCYFFWRFRTKRKKSVHDANISISSDVQIFGRMKEIRQNEQLYLFFKVVLEEQDSSNCYLLQTMFMY